MTERLLIQFRKAAQFDRTSGQLIEHDLAITKRRHAAKSVKEKTDAGGVKASLLKDEPLEHENPIFTTSEPIDGERYLLRKFGYQGDKLEHIQGKKAVDIKEMDKIFVNFEEQKAMTKKDETVRLWGRGWCEAEGTAHNRNWIAVGSNHSFYESGKVLGMLGEMLLVSLLA